MDRPDQVSGYQVHAMYVLAADGRDRHLDTNGAIANSVSSFESWMGDQTGGATMRLDNYAGRLDISFVRLAESDTAVADQGVYVRDFIEHELHARGFNDTHKIYAVYYDGSSTSSCGAGPWPPSLSGDVAVLYLQGAYGSTRCADNPVGASPTAPGYFDFSMLHEIMHTLGIVPGCAPHQTLNGHVSDSPRDLMYAGPLPWQPSVLDVNLDDYFQANIPGCLDLARSAFLDHLPAGPETPPSWPTSSTW